MSGDGTAKRQTTADGESASRAVADAARSTVGRLNRWMAHQRADVARRRRAVTIGLVVGLGLAWFHWLGLVAGGALVGVTRQSLPRAVIAGLGFGIVALVAAVLAPGTLGIGVLTALAPVSYLAIAIGLVLPVWGALARGVV